MTMTMIGSVGLYFLLAGEVSGAEAIAATPVLLMTGLYAAALRRTRSMPMLLRARGVWSLLLACRGLLPDTWRVGRALLRAVRHPAMPGVIVHVPFRFGAGAGDVGRRAAVMLGVSMAPNGIALGMDHAADELIVHQLAPHPIGGDREWPA